MAKTILISNKTYENLEDVGKNYCHDSGIAYTTDRFFSITNETFDYQLHLKSKLIFWWLKFWYNTNDYKKNKEISDRKYSKTYILKNTILFICVIGLILTLVFGLAIPIITSATKSILLLQGKATGILYANNQLIGYVFTNSEAAGILYNLQTNISSPAMNTNEINIFWNKITELGLNKTEVDNIQNQVIKFGNTFMVIDLTENMKKILLAYLFAKSDVLGGLNVSNLNWNDLVLSNNQAGQVILIPKIWIAYFSKDNVIIPIIFTLFFIVYLYLYNRRRKKVLPKIDAMSMQDFVNLKLNIARKFKFLLKRSIPMVQGIKELNHRFIFLSDALGTTQLYYNIRLLNHMYSIFKEMNIILTINAIDDNQIEQIQKICGQDFYQNIKIIIMDTEKVNELKSNDNLGYLYSDKYTSKLSQEISLNEIRQNQEHELNKIIKFKEQISENYQYRLDEQIKRINKNINKIIFTNRKRLSDNKKKKIIEEELKKYTNQKDIIEYNYMKNLTSIREDK